MNTSRRGVLGLVSGLAALPVIGIVASRFVPWQERERRGAIYFPARNRALHAWLEMHGIDPKHTRHVTIDIPVDDIATFTVEQLWRDEQGHYYFDAATGEVATETTVITAASLPNFYLLNEMRQEIHQAQTGPDHPEWLADATAWASPSRQYVLKPKEA